MGRVLRKVERQLQAQLQHLLVALLTGPSSGSPLRTSLAALILQVSFCGLSKLAQAGHGLKGVAYCAWCRWPAFHVQGGD